MHREGRADSQGRALQRLLLAVVSIASLGLITTANRLASAAAGSQPALGWLIEAYVPALLASLLVYLLILPSRPFAMPRPETPWRRVLAVSGGWLGLWLLGSVMRAIADGGWHRAAFITGSASIVEFLFVGMMAEELLFRGAIFELSERAFGDAMTWAPVVLSSALFSLEHFQFHGFRVTPGSLFMAGFTLPMGAVFAVLRRYSGSIWPGAVVHMLSAAPWVLGT